MTITELSIALDAPEEGEPLTPWGAPSMLPAEGQNWRKWFKSLTPRQRLNVARTGREE